jgi:hypothetical protein
MLYDSSERIALYRRTPYDIDTAQAKIRRAGLPPVLAERLRMGR